LLESLLQEQDTPSSSLFSSDSEATINEEETSSRQAFSLLYDEAKAKLQDMLQLLDQDISILVQDVETIRSILHDVKNSLTPKLASSLTPAAYIEGHQPQVLEAKK
jgi:hypothetical protein